MANTGRWSSGMTSLSQREGRRFNLLPGASPARRKSASAHLPKVSFVVCTYSTKGYETKWLIRKCLDSIFSQNYPKNKFEVVCVDGGSDTEALRLIKKYDVKLIHNLKKYPEGPSMGKAQGAAVASGEIIAFVDQDNELIGKGWLKKLTRPFENPEILGCTYRLLVDKKDSVINRYLSLIGTDPFAAYRSIDGLLGFGTAKLEDAENYFIYDNNQDNFVVAGGNCFLIRKKLLDAIGGYTKDADVIYKLAKKGITKIAVPKTPTTHHRTATSLWEFFKKKFIWSLHKTSDKDAYEFSWAPKNKKEWNKLIKYLSCSVFVVPNILFAAKKYLKTRESAWLLHPIMVFFSICIVAIAGLATVLRRFD